MPESLHNSELLFWQVYCRKRPINATEMERRAFDVLKVGPGTLTTTPSAEWSQDCTILMCSCIQCA